MCKSVSTTQINWSIKKENKNKMLISVFLMKILKWLDRDKPGNEILALQFLKYTMLIIFKQYIQAVNYERVIIIKLWKKEISESFNLIYDIQLF